MKAKYRLFERASGKFYIEDTETKRQESLQTKDKDVAYRLWHAKNEAHEQPAINLQIARAYLAATDAEISTRTWQHVMDAMSTGKTGSTLKRWQTAIKDKAFDAIRTRVLLETKADELRRVLDAGSVATNVFLRRIHNYALGMGWLACPILGKKQWPEVRFADKRAVTWDEHLKILDREPNKEKAAFYALAWHIGAAQTDLANLKAEDIDWGDCVIAFRRAKTGTPSLIRFGKHVADNLKKLPANGYLFPNLQPLSEKRRADYFRKRCITVGITGVTLHSYRYAWAERAKIAGYPERFAQEALGHNSKAVHRAYAKRAQVKLPSLEEFERNR
jgi:integrase